MTKQKSLLGNALSRLHPLRQKIARPFVEHEVDQIAGDRLEAHFRGRLRDVLALLTSLEGIESEINASQPGNLEARLQQSDLPGMRFGEVARDADAALDRLILVRSRLEKYASASIEILRNDAESKPEIVHVATHLGLSERLRRVAVDCLHEVTKTDLERLVAQCSPSKVGPLLGRALMDCVARNDEKIAVKLALRVAATRSTSDPVLWRSRAVEILTRFRSLPEGVLQDPSELVRQSLAKTLGEMGEWRRLIAIARNDKSPIVRAYAWTRLSQETPTTGAILAAFRDPSPLVIRVALDEVEHRLPQFSSAEREDLASELTRVSGIDDSEVAYRALALLRELTRYDDPKLDALIREIKTRSYGLSLGATLRVEEGDTPRLRRALRSLSRRGVYFGARNIRSGTWEIQVGRTARYDAGRAWYEWKHPRPDKRQNIAHVTTRQLKADIVSPAPWMGELTATKVPGEPRSIKNAGGTGAYLPTVGDLRASLTSMTEFVTPAGITTLVPPRSFWARLKLRRKLAGEFDALATLRERCLESGDGVAPEAYATRLRELGFSLSFSSDPETICGKERTSVFAPAIRCLEPAHLALPPIVDSIARFVADPTAGNGGGPLLAFLLAVLLGFFVRSLYLRRRIRNVVESIPLRLAGWGTRGKSGTERLKAAMLQGFGCDVLVKTTGCEAMTIRQTPGKTSVEVFLHRPYDKATIWEQVRVLEMGSTMGVDAFLWECMALRPRYVDVLAHHWMQSSVSTLTNAYPDHEDVHGPAGINVAEVMGGFIPPKGLCISAEEEMLPLLKAEAARRECRFESVSYSDSALIPSDLMNRFPYQAHPRNVALVAKLGAHLGLSRIDAIVAMADHVVADLGVLKTYGTVEHAARRLRFSNGMSANERAGCLSNWKRLGLHTHEGDRTKIVTVINNRGDRIPRSRVFADIVVKDLGASAHVLIGTNLGGMRQYIEESLDHWLQEQMIALPEEDPSAPGTRVKIIERLAYILHRRLGVSRSPNALLESIARVLDSVDAERADRLVPVFEELKPDPREIDLEALLAKCRIALEGDPNQQDCERWIRTIVERQTALEVFVDELPDTVDAINKSFRSFYRARFLESLHEVADSHATGDQVIDAAARAIPPGHDAHLIGIQNIKGTGLDFVYRWVDLERLQSLSPDLEDEQRRRASLAGIEKARLGILGGSWLVEKLTELGLPPADIEPFETALAEARDKASRASDVRGGIGPWVISRVEGIIDPLHALYRGHKARTLESERALGVIGHEEAAERARKLTALEKPGWLSAK